MDRSCSGDLRGSTEEDPDNLQAALEVKVVVMVSKLLRGRSGLAVQRIRG